MKSLIIQGNARKAPGKTESARLRRQGHVPCVLYGNGSNLHFSTDIRSFSKLVYTPDAHAVNIQMDGQEYTGVLQDVQYHPVTDKILHADFYAVSKDKPVVMYLPVKLTGTPAGVKAGGVLKQNLRKVKVKGQLAQMPELVKIDVEKLEIGQAVRIRDVKIEGVEFLYAPNIIFGAVRVQRAVEETPVTVAAPAEGTVAAPGTPAAAAGTEPAKSAEGEKKTPEKKASDKK